MPRYPDRKRKSGWGIYFALAGSIAAGFALTLLIFYPGMMTFDAKYLLRILAKGTLGDWQSPVMVWLWSLIDPIAPGAAACSC